jgi:hypothetical protein
MSFKIITGHYGVGKTNLALNLALEAARAGRPVMLVDLDIVNPYFRSSDYIDLLEGEGVQVIAPTFARTTLESPSLPAAVASAFDFEGLVIIDAGGDDAGATALGRYRAQIEARAAQAAQAGDGEDSYDFYYVINKYRNLSTTPAEAAALLHEIEAASGLTATAVINNSHLQADTTIETITAAYPFGIETATLLNLPLATTTVPAELLPEAKAWKTCHGDVQPDTFYPIKQIVNTPWN